MKALSSVPWRRIIVAALISILLHSLLLWQWPEWQARKDAAPLPPLQAKLVPLAQKTSQPLTKRHTKPAPLKTETTSDLPPPTTASDTDTPSAPASHETATPSTAINTDPLPPPTLPRRAQLSFSVQYGSGNFKVGEIIHQLELTDGHYTLRAASQSTGVASLFKQYYLAQTSSGLLTPHGLQPLHYEETKQERSGPLTLSSRFDWEAKRIYFSNGTETGLPEQTQDTLSLPYQLSQLPLNMDVLTVALSNGKKINRYKLTVGSDETISTAMGDLRTIKLHKAQGANEDGLIIWLALEYRLLPVKILYLDRSGDIAANMIITDIRVSDE